MNKFLIVRDSREKSGYWDWSETDECAGCTVAKVEYGDYTIRGLEDLIFIDRKKTTSEFANNITEKRFIKLLEHIKDYRYKYLILEFDLEDIYNFPLNSGIPQRLFKRCRISPSFLELWINKISLDYGVSVIFAGSRQSAERLCYSILKYIYKNECLIKNH